MFGIHDGNFEIWALLVSLEVIEILPHYHLDRMYGRLVLANLGIEPQLERFTIALRECNWCNNIEVVHETGNMKKNGVTSLYQESQS